MPREHESNQGTRGSRPYKKYTEEKLQMAVNSVKCGKKTKAQAARDFKVPYTTIIDKLKSMHLFIFFSTFT